LGECDPCGLIAGFQFNNAIMRCGAPPLFVLCADLAATVLSFSLSFFLFFSFFLSMKITILKGKRYGLKGEKGKESSTGAGNDKYV
jgi:hypothetical protein